MSHDRVSLAELPESTSLQCGECGETTGHGVVMGGVLWVRYRGQDTHTRYLKGHYPDLYRPELDLRIPLLNDDQLEHLRARLDEQLAEHDIQPGKLADGGWSLTWPLRWECARCGNPLMFDRMRASGIGRKRRIVVPAV